MYDVTVSQIAGDDCIVPQLSQRHLVHDMLLYYSIGVSKPLLSGVFLYTIKGNKVSLLFSSL